MCVELSPFNKKGDIGHFWAVDIIWTCTSKTGSKLNWICQHPYAQIYKIRALEFKILFFTSEERGFHLR